MFEFLKQFAGLAVAKLSAVSLGVLLCVTILVVGALGAFVVSQVAATRPTIEWHYKDGGGRVEFPTQTVQK